MKLPIFKMSMYFDSLKIAGKHYNPNFIEINTYVLKRLGNLKFNFTKNLTLGFTIVTENCQVD